jgi:hypothetical protein
VTFAQVGVGSDFTGTVVTIDSSNYTISLPVSFWYDSGSVHSFSFASPLVVNATKEYVWSSTSGLSTLQSGTLTVTASGSVVGNYILPNAVTFSQLGIGSGFTGTVVTIDGTPYGVSSLPVSFYWTTGSVHSFAFQSPLVVTAIAEQYVWTGTTGLSSVQSGPITVTAYGNIIGDYKTQYHLTVSSYSGLVPTPTPASGWFDAGSQVTLTAPQTGHDPNGTLYTFHGIWTVNGVDISGNTVQITMTSSTVAIAWYTDPPTFGDAAVTNIASDKTSIGQGFFSNVTVTIGNEGSFAETFNVTVYANTTAVASQDITLSSGNSTNITLTWNTTGFAYGNYTISASATLVQGETNTEDNNFAMSSVVTVTIPGDINGDFKVGLTDLVLLARAYGSKPGDSNWNPAADIKGDGVVDLADLVILAQHYGQHYP